MELEKETEGNGSLMDGTYCLAIMVNIFSVPQLDSEPLGFPLPLHYYYTLQGNQRAHHIP